MYNDVPLSAVPTAEWPSRVFYIYVYYIYVYTHTHILFLILSSITFYPRRLHFSSLCCAAGPHCFSILNVIVCIYQPQIPRPFHSLPCPPWQPQVCSPCLDLLSIEGRLFWKHSGYLWNWGGAPPATFQWNQRDKNLMLKALIFCSLCRLAEMVASGNLFPEPLQTPCPRSPGEEHPVFGTVSGNTRHWHAGKDQQRPSLQNNQLNTHS